MRVQFGDCTFDALRREVRRGERTAHLSPKAFELLRVLVESRPRALSKEELFRTLWPDTFVTEASLAGLVAEVRREIGDEAREPRFVRTIHGFGYAFSEDETLAAPGERAFRLILGSREFALAAGENTLGRGPEAAVFLDDATVSRLHARVVVGGPAGPLLEDLGSKNGTWLLGRRIESAERLKDGDEFRVGSVPLTFREFPADAQTETETRM
jgi:DNA-binding winged helix-turn-helix (wHTH) protein